MVVSSKANQANITSTRQSTHRLAEKNAGAELKDSPNANHKVHKQSQQGPFSSQQLTDSELLAIILGNVDSAEKPVATRVIGLHLLNKDCIANKAKNLLIRLGSMRAVFSCSYEHLVHKYNLTDSEALSVLSVSEMMRRIAKENLVTQVKYNSVEKCLGYFHSMLRDYPQERFSCLFLSQQFNYLGYRELFIGNTHCAPVYIGEVIRAAIDFNAVNVVVGHNHPSGDPEPSDADIEMTTRLQKSLKLIDVTLVDHIIIGHNQNVSLAQMGKM